ncbi:MAG: tol-pal system protein YbgF [Bosea sp. (in: a-proteobacteria)]
MRAVWTLLIAAMVLGVTLAAPARAQDAADLSVRINRMENQLRQLSGQIEQLQFENRRLTDQLKRFQEDVEFRLNERGGAKPSSAPSVASPATPGQPQRPRRNDAFDPNGQPGAAGAPRQLGGASTGVIDNGGPGSGQPLDVTGARQPPAAALQPGQRGPQSAVATATGTPRQSYDSALAAINSRQYEDAEMGFRQFLQSNPRDRLVPNATYWLGESYYRRSRHKDAAEQYLKVTTDHSRANIAPEAMLKLGMSLNALGARDQACATFAQVGVKYPEAPEAVRAGVERERRRVRCDG